MSSQNSNERPYNILLVEDNADDMELFLRALRKVQSDLEIEVNAQTISDGVRAAVQIEGQKFDAIFLDFNMPQPDGLELTKRIRASKLNRTTPIMIVTGAEDRTLMTRAFQAGANFFLFKPVDRMKLLRLIDVARVPIDRERRRLQRVKVKCKLTIESGKDRLDGETLDLSLDGMFVRANRTLPIGSVAHVDLKLPSSAVPVRMAARIVRVVGNEFMGVQLENIGKAESDRLGEFLVPLIASAFDENQPSVPVKAYR